MKATADGKSLKKLSLGVADKEGEKESKSDTQNSFPEFWVHVLTVVHYKCTVRCREITTHFLEEQISNTSIRDLIFNWDVSISIFYTCSGGYLL